MSETNGAVRIEVRLPSGHVELMTAREALDLAMEVEANVRNGRPKVKVNEVIWHVARVFDVEAAMLTVPSGTPGAKNAQVAGARLAAVALCVEGCACSTANELARQFNRHHTLVHYAKAAVPERMQVDSHYASLVKRARLELGL